VPEDAPVCGRICYDAFTRISTAHAFPPDFPSAEVAAGVLSMMFNHPGFYCVVAEEDGRILGSNCVDERSAIAGVGPITIDPEVQNKGVGRALMEAVLARSAERGCQGTRLLQAAFHNRSLSLYTKLGFDTREPISTMQGPPIKIATPGSRIRSARISDLEECNQLCRRVHGHKRSGDLGDAIAQALNGKYVDTPSYRYLHQVLTAHPLGGCPMGFTADDGVVNSYGEVFGYPGLYVVDGSVMPGPVGPNPSLTIAAISDRAADHIIDQHKAGNVL